MTGLLKDTFTERASGAEAPPLDLDGIIRTGNQRIRRRRTAAVLSVALASVLVLAGGITVAHNLNADAPITGVPTFAQKRPTYADGNKIHYGDYVLTVGPEKIDSFVQTDTGFVYSDAAGAVFVTDGKTQAKIGAGNKRRELTADDTGSVVGWVDAGDDDRQFVLYDVAAQRELARTDVGNLPGPPANPDREPRIVAIDNGQAYLAALDGLHRWDIDSSQDTMLAKGERPNLLYDVSNGLLAYDIATPDGGSSGTAISKTLGSRDSKAFGPTDLSPAGTYAYSEGTGTFMATDTTTGNEITFTTDYDMLALSAWLDDTTFTTIGAMEGGSTKPLDLLTCSITTKTCTITTPAFAPPLSETTPTFRLPNGTSLSEN